MSRADREGESQPMPRMNDQPFIHDLVALDLGARLALGVERYGTGLQAFNGRNPLLDAYEELLDLLVYLKQRLIEEGSHTVRRSDEVDERQALGAVTCSHCGRTAESIVGDPDVTTSSAV